MLRFLKNVKHNDRVYTAGQLVETADMSLVDEGFAEIVTNTPEAAAPEQTVEENTEQLADIQEKLNETNEQPAEDNGKKNEGEDSASVPVDTQTPPPAEVVPGEDTAVVGEPTQPADGEATPTGNQENTEDLKDIMSKLQGQE